MARNKQRRQDHIEQAQALLAGVIADLDEIILRNRQAVRRSSVVQDVLDPAIQRLEGMRSELQKIKDELAQAWIAGREK